MSKPIFDVSLARKNLHDRFQEKEKLLQKRFVQATADFKAICQMLVAKYKPGRIYQWGSLLNRDNFSDISDIDIAVEGKFGAEEFFALLKDAESLTHFPIDLVDLNKINPLHAQSIRTRGRLVYEVTTGCS
jgi:predicted nucleotidyltransferase